MKPVRFLLLIILLSANVVHASDKSFLTPALGSHMVLQRGKPNTFWGWTTPGSQVTVSIEDQKARATAGPDGKWTTQINPPKVGGPYTVNIDGPQHLELTDVLVGDVWLCGGQSNMEFGITMEKNAATEIAQSGDENLRLFFVPHQVAYTPQETNAGQWVPCSPDTVIKNGWGGFSAVGYHFGHALRRELNVPIGLIEDDWGGSYAECWTSAEGLAPLKDFNSALKFVDSLRAAGAPPLYSYLDVWLSNNDAGSKPGVYWQSPDFDDSQWKTVNLPTDLGSVGAEEGVVYFRNTVDFPNPLPTGEATLSLGSIHQTNLTWINGQYAGNGEGPFPQKFHISARNLKPGKNVITIRVIAKEGKGGFEGPADLMFLELPGGTRVPLTDGWKAKVGAQITPQNSPPNFQGYPNLPTVLSNGMLNPEIPLALRGAIWYQGESNAGHAVQYGALLPAMIADWRQRFAQGDFPFYIVSLAAFEAHQDAPGDSDWAELREAQYLTSKNVPHSGLAMTIDIGDANNIHPKDKKTVGERLALVALANEYGKDVVYSGPVYKSMSTEGSSVRISFDHADGGLKSTADKLGEFAIAGADHQWHWADAKIDDNTVVVRSAEVPDPVAVRYAWQANPVATLINGSNLPAVPFRTDDWPEITAGKK